MSSETVINVQGKRSKKLILVLGLNQPGLPDAHARHFDANGNIKHLGRYRANPKKFSQTEHLAKGEDFTR